MDLQELLAKFDACDNDSQRISMGFVPVSGGVTGYAKDGVLIVRIADIRAMFDSKREAFAGTTFDVFLSDIRDVCRRNIHCVNYLLETHNNMVFEHTGYRPLHIDDIKDTDAVLAIKHFVQYYNQTNDVIRVFCLNDVVYDAKNKRVMIADISKLWYTAAAATDVGIGLFDYNGVITLLVTTKRLNKHQQDVVMLNRIQHDDKLEIIYL